MVRPSNGCLTWITLSVAGFVVVSLFYALVSTENLETFVRPVFQQINKLTNIASSLNQLQARNITTMDGSTTATVDWYFGGIEVKTGGMFEQRIKQFNAALETLRRQIMSRRHGQQTDGWAKEFDPNNMTVIDGAHDNFLNELRVCPSITTVVLPWINQTQGPRVKPWSSLTDFSNVLYQVYHDWTADNTLCTWIETPGTIKLKADVLYNFTCRRNMTDTVGARPLNPIILNSKPINADYWPNDGRSYPALFYTDPPPYLVYMFVHAETVVTALGDVFTRTCKLVLHACSHDISKNLPGNIDSLPLYDEVFVISQYWGTSIFHRMVETMPRLSLHLDFLRSNPNIRIAALETNGGRLAELLRIVGLDPARLVAGNIRGKVVYQPRSTGCGFANVQETQVLHKVYLDYIRKNFPFQPRNRLLVVRRTGGRRFTEQKAIEEAAERLARQSNLNFTVFRDDPTPSLNDTMQLFHSAVVVIAPVGAAESNLFFSQRGTYVIEGVCNLPHVNMCLHRLAYIVGLHWHGVTSRGGCEGVVDVAATEVENALRNYIQLWTLEKGLQTL